MFYTGLLRALPIVVVAVQIASYVTAVFCGWAIERFLQNPHVTITIIWGDPLP